MMPDGIWRKISYHDNWWLVFYVIMLMLRFKRFIICINFIQNHVFCNKKRRKKKEEKKEGRKKEWKRERKELGNLFLFLFVCFFLHFKWFIAYSRLIQDWSTSRDIGKVKSGESENLFPLTVKVTLMVPLARVILVWNPVVFGELLLVKYST